MMTLGPAVDTLWGYATERGGRLDHLVGTLSLDEAYRVQLQVLDRFVASGETQSGWKVGATALAVLRQHGLDLTEPLFGYLLASGELASPAMIDTAAMVRGGVENELCLTVGRRLRGPSVTFEDALGAIDAVQPAIEVVEHRVDPRIDVNLLVADDLERYAYVVGPRVPMPPAGRLDQVRLDVVVNGRVEVSATGAEVLGNPVNSLVWLANRLAAFDRSIEPGMQVMSGSFTRQLPLVPGDRVEARFDVIGTAGLTCR